ncbi:hypothetical protein BDD12DRAFT_807491 [Trichophaea hybrida]|nr:hypothetical protein BDD12DRAFT_807491 [Trichophaea hybrida]
MCRTRKTDVQHKKRGRPRLRDDNRTHSFEIGQMQRSGILSSPSSPSAVPTSYRSSSHRILKSQVDSPRFSRRPSLTPREDILGHHTNGTSYFDQRHATRPSRINLPPISNATAYLTIDLLVAKSNENMRELLGYTAAELDCQKSLFDIVLNTDVEKVEHLSSRIRDDIRDREPKSWLSIPQLCASIQAVDESQIPSAIPGAISHSEVLHLRRPDGQYLRIRIRAHLAFVSVYFVVVVFSLANEMPPPLQLNSSSTPYINMNRLHAPAPGSGSKSSLQSPSFLTTHHLQVQGGLPGPQSPFSHTGAPSVSHLESRPRTMHHESAYPPFTQFMNPSQSPASSTFYRPSISPANVTPTGLTFSTAGQSARLQQRDLQLPPLQLKSLAGYGGIENRIQGTVVTPEEPILTETPKRERIDVREMVE